uniref:MPN domain-containing protein n=1 Tax=Craspedostauros australis TaxID=1486917 RepID=A0A7R9WUP6_9STRA|mmetsp:Transcript_18457/g.51300  ORF Transcript_18457/g.51300 Transcript_18457/m.51300 type:complete len:350 (+) Transcript_18457:244-1293(+)|eukprot:CAMPEP_0198129934 /NCGR_PEP_ID=MMETSP1442-20131203/52816_1 /TAXON_ID= /ORGANISM="Craspedostauros australis, Strain CCMP3328" /LENGTH=349 /DNA_ID=CAMNT_0043790431 /DNA_START=229 /DNA_END=1278 /DNA_ORIENTATION=+
MSSNMEVDAPSAGSGAATMVSMHPLAIVHMADQFTRITSGGSPLTPDSPVIGLLFGMMSKDGQPTAGTAVASKHNSNTATLLEIQDADDIPTEISEATTLQIGLHQAVFPQHAVVGWYRVSQEDEPTAQDLQTTKKLRDHFALDQFVFCQLQVDGNSNSGGANADEPKEVTSTLEEELPMNLYQVHVPDDKPASAVLLAMDPSNWNLATSESERIAVERVIREQPTTSAVADTSDDAAIASQSNASAYYNHQTDAVQFSLRSMSDRLNVLIQFLEDTHAGKIPPNHGLMRDVVTLTMMLGPIASQTKRQSTSVDSHVLAHLATLGKVVSVVQAYTEKTIDPSRYTMTHI